MNIEYVSVVSAVQKNKQGGMMTDGQGKVCLWRQHLRRNVNEMRGEPFQCLGNSFLSRRKMRKDELDAQDE